MNSLDQIETFFSGRCVARVVEIHQHEIKLLLLDRIEHGRGRICCFRLIARAFEEKSQGCAHVGLIIGDESARNLSCHCIHDFLCSRHTGDVNVSRLNDPRSVTSY